MEMKERLVNDHGLVLIYLLSWVVIGDALTQAERVASRRSYVNFLLA